MHMHEIPSGIGRSDERVALRRPFGEPRAEGKHEVGVLYALHEFRVWPRADVAREAIVLMREQRLAAETRDDRNIETLREARHLIDRVLIPARAADDHERLLGRPQ